MTINAYDIVFNYYNENADNNYRVDDKRVVLPKNNKMPICISAWSENEITIRFSAEVTKEDINTEFNRLFTEETIKWIVSTPPIRINLMAQNYSYQLVEMVEDIIAKKASNVEYVWV